MSESIVLDINVSVPAGPTVAISQKLTVDAYDKFDVTVPDATTALTVKLVPSGAGTVSFVLVSPAADQLSDNLTYKVNAGTATHALNGPHLLIGAGAAALLDSDPTSLTFANSSGKNAEITILIGRKVT